MGNKEEVKEVVDGILSHFRNAIISSEDGEYSFSEDGWDEFAVFLDMLLSDYRNKWFNEFLNTLQESVSEGQGVFYEFTELPIAPVRAVKAFQIMYCAGMLSHIGLIERNIFNKFVWKLLKTSSPDDTAKCRGYVSRYLSNEDVINAICHDATKGIVMKQFQHLVEKDERVHCKIQELSRFSQMVVIQLLGIDEVMLQRLEERMPQYG